MLIAILVAILILNFFSQADLQTLVSKQPKDTSAQPEHANNHGIFLIVFTHIFFEFFFLKLLFDF
jgi:hypothetical protein